MPDPDGISSAVGLQEDPREDGFVVFDAYFGQIGQAGEKKEQTSNQRRQPIEQSGGIWPDEFAVRIQLEIVAFGPMRSSEQQAKSGTPQSRI